jgi:cytochrome c oxidase cbb3-type subunit 3
MAMYTRTLLLWLALLPTAALAAPDGAELYSQHCAVCHGQYGSGGVGAPLALESFLAGVSDEYLAKTIRNGRPGRVMPAFRTLSDAQVGAIVGHVRRWSESPALAEDPTPVVGDPMLGAELFAVHCAGCHGADGEGGQGTGVTLSRPRDLPIVPPALNNPGFLAAASDQMIRATIETGREGTPMPGFGERLSAAEIGAVTRFIRSLQDQAEAPDKSEGEPYILVEESPYDLEQTVANVRSAAIAANFKIIRSDHLEHGLVPEGQESAKMMFVDFCNFKFLFEALQVDPRIGMYLPCRISVAETEDGRVLIMAVNPRALSPLFNNRELDGACETMYDLYATIIEEATI